MEKEKINKSGMLRAYRPGNEYTSPIGMPEKIDSKDAAADELRTLFNANKGLVFWFFEELKIAKANKTEGGEDKELLDGAIPQSAVLNGFKKAVNSRLKLLLKALLDFIEEGSVADETEIREIQKSVDEIREIQKSADIILHKYTSDAFSDSLFEVSKEISEMLANATADMDEYRDRLLFIAKKMWSSLIGKVSFIFFDELREILKSNPQPDVITSQIIFIHPEALEKYGKIDGVAPLWMGVLALSYSIDILDQSVSQRVLAEFIRLIDVFPPDVLWPAFIEAVEETSEKIANAKLK